MSLPNPRSQALVLMITFLAFTLMIGLSPSEAQQQLPKPAEPGYGLDQSDLDSFDYIRRIKMTNVKCRSNADCPPKSSCGPESLCTCGTGYIASSDARSCYPTATTPTTRSPKLKLNQLPCGDDLQICPDHSSCTNDVACTCDKGYWAHRPVGGSLVCYPVTKVNQSYPSWNGASPRGQQGWVWVMVITVIGSLLSSSVFNV